MANGATNPMVRSISPEASDLLKPAGVTGTYCMSVKPSLMNSSFATYWGTAQSPPTN